MLKLKLQYFHHLIQTTDSLEKSLMLGRIEGRRRRECQNEMAEWHHQCNGHELGKTSKMVRDRHASVRGVGKSRTLLSN